MARALEQQLIGCWAILLPRITGAARWAQVGHRIVAASHDGNVVVHHEGMRSSDTVGTPRLVVGAVDARVAPVLQHKSPLLSAVVIDRGSSDTGATGGSVLGRFLGMLRHVAAMARQALVGMLRMPAPIRFQMPRTDIRRSPLTQGFGFGFVPLGIDFDFLWMRQAIGAHLCIVRLTILLTFGLLCEAITLPHSVAVARTIGADIITMLARMRGTISTLIRKTLGRVFVGHRAPFIEGYL